MTKTKTLAFEIGTEEIPAFDLNNATKQLPVLLKAAFDKASVQCGAIKAYSSPRRLIIMASDVVTETEALVEEYKGPSVALAFDESGAPTKAATGFAQGKGVEPENLERRKVDGTEYVFATKKIEAKQVIELLPEILENLVREISWPKSCRWGTQTSYFSRPVRWLIALLGDSVIPVKFAGVESGISTQGHRFLAPGNHHVVYADMLIDVLRQAYVIPSQEWREEIIRKGVADIEERLGLQAKLPTNTLLEVVNLTEYPTALMGSFDEEFLKVPEEIIVDALLKHQRYFPLYDKDKKLTNRFIAVSNGNPEYSDIIIAGNERVVRPRLADAKFFYEEDLKIPLETFVERTESVVFQEALGTVRDKTKRLVTLTGKIAELAKISPKNSKDAQRAAHLLKADLVSSAVIEFTSVQGTMGSYYAQAAGENSQVVKAIAEHYRPRFAEDALPSTPVAKVVAMADKLDTICGLFAVGQAPTGSSDPFALRRGAIGIINMLASGLPMSLVGAVEACLDTYAFLKFDRKAITAEIIEFFVTRTKVMLREAGQSADVIDAVLAAGVNEPAQIMVRVEALTQARNSMKEAMEDLATAYARANNLRDAALGCDVDTALMGKEEKALMSAIESVDKQVKNALAANDYPKTLESLAALRQPIDAFFEDVKVMDKKEAVKNNRLRLLNRFVAVFTPVADFSKMAKKVN